MAGNYFHDPRPFYGLNHHDNLVSMDELFYGRREPPPWYMHQMSQHSRFDDQPRSRSMELRRPEQYIQREDQFREYRRPDMRDDIYMDYQYYDVHGANKAQQQKNHNEGNINNHGVLSHGGHNNHNINSNNNHSGHKNHGGSHNHGDGHNHGGINNHSSNNNHGGNNKGKNHQKQKNDSDEDDDNKSHKGGHHGNTNKSNKSHNNDHGHGHNNESWSDNKGFHGGGRGQARRHRRSLSLTQTVLKKLGLRGDDSSSSNSDSSSDDDRRGSRKNNKKSMNHGHVPTKGDNKAYTVRFDDQFYGHSHQSSHKKSGWFEKDYGSHGKKKSGGLLQGILKVGKNKHGDHGYSSDEENRGHKNNHGAGKGGNHQHGGNESGKKSGHSATKQHGRSQPMNFRVNLCCENCERRLKKALWKLDVDEVFCDQLHNRVVVTGNVKPETVLNKLRSVKKDTHLWH